MGELKLGESSRKVTAASVGIEGTKTRRLEKEARDGDLEGGGNPVGELAEGVWVDGIVDKWFVDKGFGFLKVRGHTVFCHADRVVGQDWLRGGGPGLGQGN